VRATEHIAKSDFTPRIGHFATLRSLLHARGSAAPSSSSPARLLREPRRQTAKVSGLTESRKQLSVTSLALPGAERLLNVRSVTLAALCALAGSLVFANAPALAATGNAYQSQFKAFEPGGLAVNSSGDLYVVEFEHNAGVVEFEHRAVYEYGPSGTGAPLAEFKETTGRSFDGENSGAIAVNASGDLYVLNGARNAVYEFNPSGTAVLGEFNGGKTAAKSFSAQAIAVNAGGDVYVADTAHHVVDEFSPSPSGEPIPLAEFNGGKTLAKSFSPEAIAVNPGPGGDVYVVDGPHHVVDEFGPSASGEPIPLAELSGSTTPQPGFEPLRVSVAANNGDVYVDGGVPGLGGLVDRFSSTGTYLSQFEGGATPQGRFEPGGELVAAPSGQVYVEAGFFFSFEFSYFVDRFSEPVPVPIVTTGPTSTVEATTATTATLTGSIEPTGGLEASCEFRYNGVTVPCEPAGPFSSSLNAVEAKISGLTPETTYGYRLLGTTSEGTTAGEEKTFTTLGKVVSPPTVSIAPVAPIGEHSATFNGEVNPNGAETKYHFEYSADGVNWTPLEKESAGEGTSGVPVTQTVSGLTGHSPYRVRLVAENSCSGGTTGCGASTSSEETFSTLAAPQQVSGTGATAINSGEATLRATIRTENNPTTYRFEYGPTASYGTTVPAGEGDLGASSTPTQVSQAITGLSPNTTYHFRVLASNGVGPPTATPDQTFTTFSNAGAAGCPNERIRSESAVNPETGLPFSLQLPECRAYEMVSPPLTNGAPFTPLAQGTGIHSASSVARVGLEGSTVLIKSTGIWPGAEQPANNDLLITIAEEAVRYKVTRGESGWGFKPEVPPASDVRVYKPLVVPDGADLGLNGIWTGAGFAPSETESNMPLSSLDNPQGNLYLLEPNGSTLAEVGPSVPLSDRGINPEATGGYESIAAPGASADLSRVLFEVRAFRWPFDQTDLTPIGKEPIRSLYEYFGTGHTGEGGDVPTLVGVDNTGALISQCGTEAGGGQSAGLGGGQSAGAISADGSTVFFTARAADAECAAASSTGAGTGPAVSQLFARVGEPGKRAEVGSAVTVNVAASSECATATFDSCNVANAVKYQGASTDGSKVFFTSEQPELVSGDTDSTNSLYECRLPGDSGAPLIRMSPVNPCPDLVRVSIPVSGAGAEVQSVAAVSADGSHVYFIAKGVLSGENAEHNSPTPGQDNLYVWREPSAGYPQGGTAFIATLPSAALGAAVGEGGQATPDGNSFVFTSTADLTPDDTSTVNQVFLYEAKHEALIRASKGQDGFNHDGNTTTDGATIATGAERRTISADGSTVVFQSSDALTSQVHGGTNNVYLWRGGNVSLISDGTPAGENSGKGATSIPEAGLVGIDASGQNVFFTTAAKLVSQDTGELSAVYDARVDGGFPAPKNDECVGEACQGALSAPPGPLSPGSLSPSGTGNVTPPPAPSAKPTVEILKIKVTATTLLVTVRTSAKGRVQISGKGLTTTIKEGLKAGTHQIKVKLTKAGRKAGAHRKKTRLRVSLTVVKQTVAKTTSVKL
jgi:hypothetical protein